MSSPESHRHSKSNAVPHFPALHFGFDMRLAWGAKPQEIQVTVPNWPSSPDIANAKKNKPAVTLILSPAALIRVLSSGEHQRIITSKEWERYLKKAQQAYRDKQRGGKIKKHPQQSNINRSRPGETGTVIDHLSAESNEPLSGW